MVQGQPGPNMRAASYQAQQQPKKAASSFIMPMYTLGIVAFFVFTIVKIVMKKTNKSKVKPFESDPVFVEKVFKKVEADPKNKLGETLVIFLTIASLAASRKRSHFFYLSTQSLKFELKDGKIIMQVRKASTNLPNAP